MLEIQFFYHLQIILYFFNFKFISKDSFLQCKDFDRVLGQDKSIFYLKCANKIQYFSEKHTSPCTSKNTIKPLK